MIPFLAAAADAAQSTTLIEGLTQQALPIVLTVIYFLIGLALFGLSVLIIEKAAPFSIRKEIEEDENTALGILMAGIFIGLAIILGATIAS